MVRLDPKKLEHVGAVLEEEITLSRLPGAVVCVGIGSEVLYQGAFGFAENLHGVSRPMQTETIFDLASLTKVTAVLPSVLCLVEDGKIRLNDAVATFIPEFGEQEEDKVTIRHLLTHSSGLPSHRAYYREFSNREEILEAVRRQPRRSAAGTEVVYSDIGFILLGEVIREVTGKPLDEFVQNRVFAPLGMNFTTFCPPKQWRERIAATEEDPVAGVKVGTVHDENAAALGGVSGHAGLFAPASDLVKYVQMWLGGEPSLLSPWMREKAVSLQTPGLDGRRGLGWVARRDAYDHTGDLWPDTAVGHTGFTGTSIAFDPVSELWMIVLTNDVHYGRNRRRMIRLRGLLHNIVGAAVRTE